MEVIMDAKTAKQKTDEILLLKYNKLIAEYTELINNRILESINKGKSYYGCKDIILYSGDKYEEIEDIVESKFEEKGYKFMKNTHAAYFRWDDEDNDFFKQNGESPSSPIILKNKKKRYCIIS